MIVYLITSKCDGGGVDIHAAETDYERAKRLYEIFHEDNSDVHLEEWDTRAFADLIAGKIPYCVGFRTGRDPQVELAHWRLGEIPAVVERKTYIDVYVYAASKDEAYQKAVEIHRDYVTKKYFK